MEIYYLIIVAVTALAALGAGSVYLGNRYKGAEQKIKVAQETAKHLVEDAKKEAERARKEALLEAKDESIKLKTDLEREHRERKAEFSSIEKRLDARDDRLEAKEKEIQIYRRFGAHLPKIFIDKEQIKQVSMNIILNALQSIEGRGVVEVSTRLFTKNHSDQYIQIEIRDSGAGIPGGDLENIFNPFFSNIFSLFIVNNKFISTTFFNNFDYLTN